ncbi:uncharacterized protein LOC126880339 isoform X2 [Diabrotica virgifera virgifera]|uniref:Uncharacterized protein n=1 Tax=Diabrotica virgifera virgifera TaxID=50390 RepID=A0ABM5JQ88_DIAVI|nr:uncharacterized protein LOC126880339 isoform X2 [Diabrotica virgifera virgifera]
MPRIQDQMHRHMYPYPDVEAFNLFVKWRYASLIFTGTLAFGGVIISVLSENLLTNILQFKWYQWNKANCQMFNILLLQIQDPLLFKCFAFPYINRELLLRVFRVVHGYIACFQSMKKQ